MNIYILYEEKQEGECFNIRVKKVFSSQSMAKVFATSIYGSPLLRKNKTEYWPISQNDLTVGYAWVEKEHLVIT